MGLPSYSNKLDDREREGGTNRKTNESNWPGRED